MENAIKDLSDNELWERVKYLEGKTVCTIERRVPNIVVQVTDTEVRLAKNTGELRPTTPIKSDIVNTYRYLFAHGQITGDDFEKIPEYRPWGKVGRIVLAILRDAIPDQIEDFRRVPSKSLSGVRLRTK